jgi:hypothetical protein
MDRFLLLILAGTETHEGLGRLVNALEVAKELGERGAEVRLVFDGAGTEGLAALANPEHKAHPLFRAVADRVEGACHHCAGAFGVRASLEALGQRLLADYEGHPSLAGFLLRGYRVLTF